MPMRGDRVTLWYVLVIGGAGNDRTDGPGRGGRRPLRAGHADRDQVIETLKNAFVHGRLTKDELDARAGQALTARTRAELAALTADLPASPQAAPSAQSPARPPGHAGWLLATAAAGSGACLAAASGLVLFAVDFLDPHGLGNPGHPWSAVCASFAFVLLILALFIAVLGTAAAVEQRRLRGQLPPAKGRGQRLSPRGGLS